MKDFVGNLLSLRIFQGLSSVAIPGEMFQQYIGNAPGDEGPTGLL